MAKCKECRKKVRSNWKSCPYCGTPVQGGVPVLVTLLTITIVLWVMGTYFSYPG